MGRIQSIIELNFEHNLLDPSLWSLFLCCNFVSNNFHFGLKIFCGYKDPIGFLINFSVKNFHV